jgi:uncharacterized protein (TIGR02646 family)
MRRVKRGVLDKKVADYLAKRQLDADAKLASGALKPDDHWKATRQTQSVQEILLCLQNMMGERQRCMYCVDSHGSDIEHFRPKAEFQTWMYRWENLLLCCTECGRFKGSKFPLLGGAPLLLDPSIDEPWQYLDFDPATGNITARFDITTNVFQIKGEKTVEVLQLDRREALAAGYKKTYRILHARLAQFLETPTSPAELITNLIEHDEHGLLGWFFKGNGQTEDVLKKLRVQHGLAWNACMEAFAFR